MKNIFLETNKADSIENFHIYLKDVFEFPKYYGKNLDALYDCLTSISEQITVTLPFGFEEILDGYGKRIIKVFNNAARANEYLYLCMAEESPLEQ